MTSQYIPTKTFYLYKGSELYEFTIIREVGKHRRLTVDPDKSIRDLDAIRMQVTTVPRCRELYAKLVSEGFNRCNRRGSWII